MDMTLLVLAAGIGSRYGDGIKQIAKMDENGYTIIDYSIHDAIKAGFNRVVFIIRKEIEEDFKEVIGDRISKIVRVDYAYQNMDLPGGFESPKERTKPWGTVDAVLAAKDQIGGPFLVINADDYYGKEVFKDFYDFLSKNKSEDKVQIAMAGYKLKNTLSDNGTVTRGVSVANDEGKLIKIMETHEIRKNPDGSISSKENLGPDLLNEESLVSMNTWASDKAFIDLCEDYFIKFLEKNKENLDTAEYVLPDLIASLIADDKCEVTVIPTQDIWIGITYKEDLKSAQDAFRQMIEAGKYPKDIWKK